MKEKLSKSARIFLDIWNSIVVIASAWLIYELSYEILGQINPPAKSRYSITITWLCIIFIADFVVSTYFSIDRWRFIRKQYFFLLSAIPYHEIFMIMRWPMSEIAIYLFRIILLIRGIRGIAMFIRLLSANTVNRILISYSFYLIMILYFSSISFYYFEDGLNPGIKGYGDAIWWAFMALTTEGSNIHPVTIEGRIITGVLITSGLGLFTLIVAGFADRFSKMRSRSGVALTDIGLTEDVAALNSNKKKQQSNASNTSNTPPPQNSSNEGDAQ